MTLKRKIKTIIKNSIIYQKISWKRLYPVSLERYNSMPNEERTPIRLCLKKRNNKINQYHDLFNKIEININEENYYQYWIDTGLFFANTNSKIDNSPIDYSLIIDNSIQSLMERNSKVHNNISKQNIDFLSEILIYIDRIINEIDKRLSLTPNNIRLRTVRNIYSRMKFYSADSLDEALQRILFWNSIIWQTEHRLVGLGRLDKILHRFSSQSNKADLTNFLKIIHSFYFFKSNYVSLGDTGQIIILGGLDEDGSYFCNQISYDIIAIVRDMHIPDPKILLRVAKNIPSELLELAVQTIQTGIGCPLLSNDDVVIPALIDFGYQIEDAYNYVTSACWEPLAFGKSLEVNNIEDINYAQVFYNMCNDISFLECKSFDDIVNLYLKFLIKNIRSSLQFLNTIQWEKDPLITLFTDGCLESNLDISEGGSKYKNYGILSVGMGNTIDSLMNVKRFVFDNTDISLSKVREIVLKNYVGYERYIDILSQESYYCRDDDYIILLCERIKCCVENELKQYVNPLGGKLKVGLSSSNYKEIGKLTNATFDGRRNHDALDVHISSRKALPYSELISFASKLNYNGLQSNGNVIDFVISPVFIRNNYEKFIIFIKKSISVGFFEMQMNVVDSNTLIEAKKNPGSFPDLIVRVWGFSAYFKDLPDDYKDVLIKRALISEGKVA